jgi:hypothetical protein
VASRAARATVVVDVLVVVASRLDSTVALMTRGALDASVPCDVIGNVTDCLIVAIACVANRAGTAIIVPNELVVFARRCRMPVAFVSA